MANLKVGVRVRVRGALEALSHPKQGQLINLPSRVLADKTPYETRSQIIGEQSRQSMLQTLHGTRWDIPSLE